jgi:group I intron endonuclease
MVNKMVISTKKTGIYRIVNKVNKKVYVGSSINIRGRWAVHKSDLRRNKHHNYHLQKSWNKYGERNFSFMIIEECTKKKLDEREDYWMKRHKSHQGNKGYNLKLVKLKKR